jgi:hypothetical protein
MPKEIVVSLRGLQPIVAIGMKRDAELNKTFGKSDDVLLEISRLIATIEINSGSHLAIFG